MLQGRNTIPCQLSTATLSPGLSGRGFFSNRRRQSVHISAATRYTINDVSAVHQKSVKCLLAALLICAGAPTLGAEPFGLQLELDRDTALTDDSAPFQLFLGKRINRFLSFEASYSDYGAWDRSIDRRSGLLFRGHPSALALGFDTSQFDVETDALSADLRLDAQMNDMLSVTGRVGITSWRNRFTARDETLGAYGFEHNDTDPFFSIAAALQLYNSVSLEGSYELLDTDSAEIDAINLGLRVRF